MSDPDKICENCKHSVVHIERDRQAYYTCHVYAEPVDVRGSATCPLFEHFLPKGELK